ncbi:MAG: helix-turn-helix domain-containing protein [Aggregatilineales bacterium]
MTRSYHQYCPIAYSLDLVGDRWTILVVRELIYGPRRYTDIQRGLPKMASNLLSRRLTGLEESGLLHTRHLPPPAAITVYELTDYGRTLKILIDAHTRWGLHLMIQNQSLFAEDFLGIMPLLNALNVLFDAEAGREATLTAELHIGDEVVHCEIANGKIHIAQGAATQPDVIAQAEPKTVLMLAVGSINLTEALKSGMIAIQRGEEATLKTFFDLFRFPVEAV